MRPTNNRKSMTIEKFRRERPGLEVGLPAHVQNLLRPLFVLFDCFEPAPEIICDIVEEYVKGRVT